jgi:hypothetical protein
MPFQCHDPVPLIYFQRGHLFLLREVVKVSTSKRVQYNDYTFLFYPVHIWPDGMGLNSHKNLLIMAGNLSTAHKKNLISRYTGPKKKKFWLIFSYFLDLSGPTLHFKGNHQPCRRGNGPFIHANI